MDLNRDVIGEVNLFGGLAFHEGAEAGTLSKKPWIYRKSVLACRRSAAISITVARSPGAKKGR